MTTGTETPLQRPDTDTVGRRLRQITRISYAYYQRYDEIDATLRPTLRSICERRKDVRSRYQADLIDAKTSQDLQEALDREHEDALDARRKANSENTRRFEQKRVDMLRLWQAEFGGSSPLTDALIGLIGYREEILVALAHFPMTVEDLRGMQRRYDWCDEGMEMVVDDMLEAHAAGEEGDRIQDEAAACHIQAYYLLPGSMWLR